MRVHMLKTETVVQDKRSSKNYPADWKGEVDDTIALKWIKAGSAEQIADDVSSPVELTDQEKAVLKSAAQQAIRAMLAGEPSDPAAGEGSETEQTPAEILKSMTKKELDALAKQEGIKTVGVKRPAIEAALLEKIAAAAPPAA